MNTIRKGGSYRGQRITIKAFKTPEAMHDFLNKLSNNEWMINSEPDYLGGFKPELACLKAGVYAFAGGKWHNVKSLDVSVLAHI